MKAETIVTLEGKDRYYLADETEQNGIKYFLGNKLDEKDEQTDESYIFEEVKYGIEYYLDIVKDEKTINFIAAVFTSNFVSEVDEM